MMSALRSVSTSETCIRVPFMNDPRPRAALSISSRKGSRRCAAKKLARLFEADRHGKKRILMGKIRRAVERINDPLSFHCVRGPDAPDSSARIA